MSLEFYKETAYNKFGRTSSLEYHFLCKKEEPDYPNYLFLRIDSAGELKYATALKSVAEKIIKPQLRSHTYSGWLVLKID